MRKTHAAVSELARYGLQQLIELEASAAVGADGHERSEERTNYRYGYRPRTLTTQVGDRALQIPKLRADQALYAVIMEAYIGGVSTREVESRICQDIDQQVQAFLSRPLESSGYAYRLP
jgi:putative transposase